MDSSLMPPLHQENSARCSSVDVRTISGLCFRIGSKSTYVSRYTSPSLFIPDLKPTFSTNLIHQIAGIQRMLSRTLDCSFNEAISVEFSEYRRVSELNSAFRECVIRYFSLTMGTKWPMIARFCGRESQDKPLLCGQKSHGVSAGGDALGLA